MALYQLAIAFCLIVTQSFGKDSKDDGNKECYGKYGCFSKDPPFNTNVLKIFPRPLPNPPEEMETKYFLFTREDRIGFVILDDSDVNKLKDSSYDGSKTTYMIIHGWTGKPLETPWVKDMKDALLEREDSNVFIIGWKEGASELYYPQSVGNTRLVGAMVAEFIKFLNKQTKNTPESFYVIGFSLGAQVSGYAGKRIQDTTDNKIGRITGLDPAGPGYKGEHIDVRLDATDAAFVDVIHTDCPNIGTPTKSGKFDFWPNGGSSQPGCAIKKKGSITKLIGCEHFRAHQYFIESIKTASRKNACKFRAYPCRSYKEFSRGKCLECGPSGKKCPEMGINAIEHKSLESGNFYIFTNKESPYCVPRLMFVTFETGHKSLVGGGGHNPRIRIHGSKSSTEEIKLKGDLKEDSTEKYLVPIGRDIGELKRVEVRNHMDYVLVDPWKVSKVSLKYVDEEQRYIVFYVEHGTQGPLDRLTGYEAELVAQYIPQTWIKVIDRYFWRCLSK